MSLHQLRVRKLEPVLLTVGVFISNRFIRDETSKSSSPLSLTLWLEIFFLIQDFAYEAS